MAHYFKSSTASPNEKERHIKSQRKTKVVEPTPEPTTTPEPATTEPVTSKIAETEPDASEPGIAPSGYESAINDLSKGQR